MKPFDDASVMDELRRHAAGSMSPDEAARFEAELARDPELARLAADFRLVWTVTASGLGEVAPSRASFADIVARAGVEDERRSPWMRRAAAAAIVLVIAAVGWAALRQVMRTQTRVVELREVPWSGGAPAAAENAALPAVLAEWSPVQNGQIRWLESMDEARAVSAAVSRPIFVYGYIETCPICQGFQANEFKDPEILALVNQSVPVRINLLAIDEEEMEALTTRRYPLLEIQDENGGIVRTFPGQLADGVDIRAELASAVAGLAGPNWKMVHDLAKTFLDARAAETGGRLGDASGEFASLAAARGLPRFAAAGNAGLARVAAASVRLLEEARARALAGEADALTRFEAESKAFAGTPFEADLRAVFDAWRDSGKFPELAVHK